MTFDPARPRQTITFDGKDYTLVGTMELIEAVELTFREGIQQIAIRTIDMGMTDTARLFSAMLVVAGYKLSPKEIASILYSTGINSPAFQSLKVELYGFLRIVLEPPELREKTAMAVGELIGKPIASPGDDTKNSV